MLDRPLIKILAVFLILFLSRLTSLAAAAGDLPERTPVATVNGVPIFESDLNCAVEAALAQMISTHSGLLDTAPDQEAVQRTTLDRLIDTEILYQESLKNRFPGLSKMAEESYRREVRRLGGERQLKTALRCNNMTPEQFKQSIFRNLSINRYLDRMVYSKVRIEEEDLERFYRENRSLFARPPSARLRLILIRATNADEKGEQEAELKARNVYEQAVAGEDFSFLARKYSDDPASAAAGGDVGVVFKGSLRSGFDTIVFSLSPGRITSPLRSRHGFHIYQVVGSEPSATPPLEEVRDGVVSELRRQKIREGVTRLLDELRSMADIVLYPR